MTRATVPLHGAAWRVKGHLSLDAALQAAERPVDASPGWLPASVPGSVLHDLWQAGEVADPYVERNSLSMEWVPERAWTYRCTLPEIAPVEGGRIHLRFDGVDHACHVFLDGQRMARHEGMFVPFEVDVTERVLAGASELAVVVEPAPPNEPQGGRTSRVRIHKSRMTYGWDFCPRMIHQGIWQPVSLTTSRHVRLLDVRARPELSPDLRRATVTVTAALAATRPVGVRVEAELQGVSVGRATAGHDATPGVTDVTLAFDVDEPALWWPNGLGDPVVHRLTVRVSDRDELLDEREVPLGFRTIELAANEGAPADALPYTFVVNGRRLPINGWNWVPLDALYGVPRPERLHHLLRLAARANVQLLRVWGGGLIETEAFYDACDRLGIMVWQEFAQSSSGTDDEPATDDAFVDAMRREAEAIVPLRRDHPSLALWCGGNELQGPGGPLDDRAPVLRALRDVVARLDPGRAWLPTSPTGPRFHNRLADIEADPDGLHDVHGPWEHQGLTGQYALYDRGTSLFNSEFGVEGMTNRRAHEALIAPERRWPATRANAVYRHLGDWWNNESLVQHAFGGRLAELEALRRASQWLQAEGLRYAVEANRRRAPRQSGSIPWQFNESYPNAWCTAAVDHLGDPKPAYHAVARAYAPTVVCARIEGAALGGSGRLAVELWAWSDGAAVRDATVRWRIVGVGGAVIHEQEAVTALAGGRPIRVVDGVSVALPDAEPLLFLDLALEHHAGRVRATNRYLFTAGNDFGAMLDVAPAALDVAVVADGDRWRVDLAHRSGPAALGVTIEDARPAAGVGWAESDDNGFDLLPGETRSIGIAWACAPLVDRRLRIGGWNVAQRSVEAGRAGRA